MGRLLNFVAFPREKVLCENIQYIGTEHTILTRLTRVGVDKSDDWDVHLNNLKLVGLSNLKRGLENIQELRQIFERHVLGAFGVKLSPYFVEKLVILIRDPLLNILASLESTRKGVVQVVQISFDITILTCE